MAQQLSVTLLLLPLLLPDCFWARPGAPSVFYNFNITLKVSPWCEFECQVNGNPLLWYNCSQKGICECDILSMLSRAIETCNGEEEIPKDVTEHLKFIVLNMTGFPSLMGNMTCQWDENGHAYGSWYFSINGKEALHLDSKNGKKTVLNSEGKLLNETLNNHKDVIGFLRRKPAEMCEEWYEKVWNHQENVLNTAAPVTSEPTTEPPTSASATDQSKNVNIVNIVCIIVGIVISLIIPRSYVFDICRKRRRRQPAGQEAPTGDCVGQDEEASFLQTHEIPGEPSCSQSRDSQLPADWGERSTERLCLEQRLATQTGSAVSCISLSDSEV